MINQDNVELMFDVLDESALILYQKYKTPYLEGVIKTCENIVSNSVEVIDDDIRVELLSKIKRISNIDFQKEEIRKAFQFACLKGYKHANISNQMITPETIGIFINYLVTKLYNKKKFNILDPVSGTSNLIACVANHLDEDVNLFCVEKDLLSYKLSLTLLELLGYGEQVFYQDSLTYLSPKMDLIIGDFSGIVEKEIYSLIKHHGNNIIDGGFLIGVFDDLTVSEKVLIKHAKDINEIWKLFGLIRLPKGILKNQSKSIVIFQKTGKLVIQPKRFLLVDLPEFSNKEDMKIVINHINDWFKNTEFYKLGEK
ncbi:class I SAM-dependent methyltransferase [Candidatus Izemoplasma sp. B36]|uniref:class I SAM-dependent methyltransferase n=1 Tax=Candidatus Izemoplasma sp. B36 TaxID=3242468 RepID=UPI0035587A5F